MYVLRDKLITGEIISVAPDTAEPKPTDKNRTGDTVFVVTAAAAVGGNRGGTRCECLKPPSKYLLVTRPFRTSEIKPR